MGKWIRIAAACMAAGSAASVTAADFSITPNTSSGSPSTYKWSVSVNGNSATNNPTLEVLTGSTYTIHVSNVSTHPFWIDKSPGLGGFDPYPKSGGISDNGVTVNTTITMNLEADAPDTLYYACGFHSSMIGTISVVHDLMFRDAFE